MQRGTIGMVLYPTEQEVEDARFTKPDEIWYNEKSGGKVYVGDLETAISKYTLEKLGIYNVVNT